MFSIAYQASLHGRSKGFIENDFFIHFYYDDDMTHYMIITVAGMIISLIIDIITELLTYYAFF